MSVDILDTTQRVVLASAGVLFAALAVVMRARRARTELVAAAVAAALIAGAILAAEAVIDRVVEGAAPAATDFNEFRWVLMSPWGRAGLALGVATAITVIVLSWIATAGLRSPWRRAAVICLRAGAATTALVLFLEPAVELRQVAREPNRIAVLVDESLSMSLTDGSDGPSRAERARAILDASDSAFEHWRRDHRIDFYTFSESVTPSSREAIRAARAEGRDTFVRRALEQTRARFEGADLAGVVLVSDGIATGNMAEDAAIGATREFLRSLDTRVHTVWSARPGLKDVAVAQIRADEFGFVRTVMRVEAVIRATGYDRRRIPVLLSGDGVPMRRKWIDIGPGDTEVTVFFEFTPNKVGKFVYEISTPVAEDEAVEANNTSTFVLRVIRDKIRVLQVAGQPSWDVRALRGMLKQNPNVDLISFFLLRTQDDISQASNSELSLIPFPTQELFQEELPSFDLVVLQNFDYLPYGIGPYLENMRRYVEGGGGLVMLGGAKSFASGRYTGTPIAKALPIKMPSPFELPDQLIDTELFSPVLTERGQAHPITSLRFETGDNLRLWESLPELEGVNVVQDAKKGAAVLAVHPRLKTPSGKPMPVMVAGHYGDGRTLTITTDSLWRWGFVAAGRAGEDGRSYLKLWDNAIRWLMDDPDLRYLHVDSDKVEYTPDETARLDVRLLDQDYTPLEGGKVELEIVLGSDPATAALVDRATITVDERGEGQHHLSELESGVYRVRASGTVGGRRVEASDILVVRDASAELARPSASPELLEEIAASTGGRFLGAADELPADLKFEEPRIVRVDRRSDVELWSRPWLLFVALLFLGAEWGLRQQSGYL